MNVLSPLAPGASSFHVGLRTLSRRSEKLVFVSVARCFSSASKSPPPCSISSLGAALGPTRTLRDMRVRHDRFLPRISVRTAFKFREFRAIVDYTAIPDSYTDADGLPFRKEDLNQYETRKIFGSPISASDANRLLRIIHGRRVAGTLDDPDLQVNTEHYSTADKIAALEYLRKHVPVDEVINAGLRAEDELRLLEEQQELEEPAQAEQIMEEPNPQQQPPTQPPPAAIQETVENTAEPTVPTVPLGKIPRPAKNQSPYGESTFDRIRQRNLAKQEEERQRAEEERRKREEEMALNQTKGGPPLTIREAWNRLPAKGEHRRPSQMPDWVKKHYDGATSDLKAPPKMKAWERLLPIWATASLVLAGCVALAYLYKPPRAADRFWPTVPPAAATCLGLILANLAVFALWRFPPAWGVLNRYFVLTAATPRPLQLLGAMFSHQKLWTHLVPNMCALWFFGVRLHDDIGRGHFLALYTAAGATGFLASFTHMVLVRGLHFTTLGASGAVYGLVAAYFWRHRFEEFKTLGLPPDPMHGPNGLTLLAVFAGLTLYGLVSRGAAAAHLDTWSHAGGLLAGIVAVEAVERRRAALRRDRAAHLESMGVLDKAMHPSEPAKPKASPSKS